MTDPIIGRDEQLAQLRSCMDAVPSGARVVVIEGEAGIGKTALLTAALGDALTRSLTVLRTTAYEAEAKLSFAGLGDLLGGVLGDGLAAVPAPQRRALELALLLEAGDDAPPEPRAVAAATLSVLRALAGRASLVVAVDDVQWLDRPSAAVLAYSLRRLHAEPVLSILSQRVDEAAALPLGLDRFTPDVPLDRVALGPLSFAATQRLLRTRLGLLPPRPLLRRVHEACRGNPLFALELGATLRDERPAAGERFTVPPQMRLLVRDRVQRLPRSTRDALLIAASLDRPTLGRVAAAIDDDARARLAPAIRAQIVDLERERVAFTHPLLASAVIDAAEPDARRAAHRRLAAIVVEPEQRARHLALAAEAPDAGVAGELESVAAALIARGAPDAAADLAEQAQRLTPASDPDAGVRRAVQAGWYHFIAGDSDRAMALLVAATASCPSGRARDRGLIRLARLNMHAGDRREALELYREVLQRAGDALKLRAEVHEGLAWCLFLLREDVAAAARHARAAVRLAERAGDRVVLVDALSVQAQSEFFLGGGLPSAAMERALTIRADAADPRVLRQPSQHWGVMLLIADELDAARAELTCVHDRAVEHGDETALPWVLMRLAHVELLAGRWDLASAHARDGYEHALHNGQLPLRAELRCTEALIAAHRGAVDAARSATAEGLELAARTGAGIGLRLAPWSLGLLALSQGDAAAARDQLAPLWQASVTAGIADPGENRYASDLVEALVTLGDVDEAESVLTVLEERARELGRASALATVARCRGLLLAARGRLDNAGAAFEDALIHHTRAPLPFERARTLLAFGTLQRRAKHRASARELLEQAASELERLGASLWTERARAELARIGGRTPTGAALTPTEERIAALVAEGLSNKEIAAALFVTAKTVETQLSRIYAKLGIHSRTQLARHVRSTTPA